VIERQQWLVDAEVGPVSAEGIVLAHNQSRVFEDGQGVRQFIALPPHVAGDAAAASVACCDGRQYRVVERGVPQFGLLGQQIAGFEEHRASWRKDCPGDPGIEVG
jgi:hypothetical protein